MRNWRRVKTHFRGIMGKIEILSTHNYLCLKYLQLSVGILSKICPSENCNLFFNPQRRFATVTQIRRNNCRWTRVCIVYISLTENKRLLLLQWHSSESTHQNSNCCKNSCIINQLKTQLKQTYMQQCVTAKCTQKTDNVNNICYSAEHFLKWRRMVSLYLSSLPHKSQLNILTSECLSWCCRKSYAVQKLFGHSSHKYNFTPSWRSKWDLSQTFSLNFFWQIWHVNQVPSLCDSSRCALSW